jgi:predicted nucleic acid-binding protein
LALVKAAGVYDVRTDRPRVGDRFFVDTNVWKYFTYANATTGQKGRPTAKATYSRYLTDCLDAKATLYWSPLSYSELAHVVETVEMEIYNATAEPHMVCRTVKQFRSGDVERLTVVAEMRIVWEQVSNLGTALPTATDEAALKAAITLFEGCPLDGYDVFYVNAMRDGLLDAVITDDIDFISVPGLRVFTANDAALRQAAMFKKMSMR